MKTVRMLLMPVVNKSILGKLTAVLALAGKGAPLDKRKIQEPFNNSNGESAIEPDVIFQQAF